MPHAPGEDATRLVDLKEIFLPKFRELLGVDLTNVIGENTGKSEKSGIFGKIGEKPVKNTKETKKSSYNKSCDDENIETTKFYFVSDNGDDNDNDDDEKTTTEISKTHFTRGTLLRRIPEYLELNILSGCFNADSLHVRRDDEVSGSTVTKHRGDTAGDIGSVGRYNSGDCSSVISRGQFAITGERGNSLNKDDNSQNNIEHATLPNRTLESNLPNRSLESNLPNALVMSILPNINAFLHPENGENLRSNFVRKLLRMLRTANLGDLLSKETFVHHVQKSQLLHIPNTENENENENEPPTMAATNQNATSNHVGMSMSQSAHATENRMIIDPQLVYDDIEKLTRKLLQVRRVFMVFFVYFGCFVCIFQLKGQLKFIG